MEIIDGKEVLRDVILKNPKITGGTVTGLATDIAVADGGTGVSTIADGGLVIGNAAGAIEADVAGLTTQVLVGGGALTKPVWTVATGTGAPVRADSSALTTVASITKTAIGVTQSDAYGLGILNTTAAAAGAQQYSPPLVFRGSGWKTNATAASQKVEFLMDVRPVQGAAAPTGYLGIYPSIADAAYLATPAIAVTSANYVGIGPTAPTERLTVGDATVSNQALLIQSRTTSSDSALKIAVGSSIIAQLLGTSNATTLGTGGVVLQTTTNHPIVFRTNSSGVESGGNERMRITESGNIGIGATTFGTDAAKVLGIGNGTAPTTRPADMVQMWAADYAAGDSRLYLLGEGSADTVIIGKGSVVLGTGLVNNGFHLAHRTAVGAANYNPSILTTDYIIAMTDTAAARAVIISTEDEDTGSTDNPRVFVIKDESGNAAANNITVTLESGGTIDGAASYVINQNYQSITLYVDSVYAHIY